MNARVIELEATLRMARESLAEFHQTGDVPDALQSIDAVLAKPAPAPALAPTVRACLAYALWRHQGGSSPVGQPIRVLLGMGPEAELSADDSFAARAVFEQFERSSAISRDSLHAAVMNIPVAYADVIADRSQRDEAKPRPSASDIERILTAEAVWTELAGWCVALKHGGYTEIVNLIERAERLFDGAELDANRLHGLIELAGSHHDGGGETVSLFEDDATYNYHVKWASGRKGTHGATPREAIDKALSTIEAPTE